MSKQYNVRKQAAHDRLTHLKPGGCVTLVLSSCIGDREEAAAFYHNKSVDKDWSMGLTDMEKISNNQFGFYHTSGIVS